MALTDRQKSILEKTVTEYIHSASPVSSSLLERRYDFGVCPATIRNDLYSLTEAGFLYQPHTSAGRVPTDKGYRFFVDNLLEEEALESEGLFDLNRVFGRKGEDMFYFVDFCSKCLAEASSALATVHLLERKVFLKDGWEDVLREPEFGERQFVERFSRLLRGLESQAEDMKLNSEVRIFIGKENPFTRDEDFAVISAKCYFPDKEKGVVSLLGPKRMEYGKNISLINSLIKALEDF